MASLGDPSLAFALVAALIGFASLAYLARRLDPAWAFSLGIACSVFSGHWDELGLPVGPDRLLLLLGALALLVRHKDARDRLRPEPVHWLLALIAAYAVGSAFWVGSLFEAEGVFSLLDRLGIVPFVMFFLAPAAFRTARQRAILLGTLLVLGAYLGLTALFEAIGADALVLPKYILDPTVGIHTDRARGPFGEAVGNGLGLYACTVAAVISLAVWRGPFARSAAIAVVLLCGVGVVFTLTRAIWLGAVLATATTLIAVPRLRRFLLPTAAVGAALVVGALVLVPGLSQQAEDRQGDQRPVWDRFNTNRAAMNMVAERPLLGFGWNQFVDESDDFFEQGEDYPLTDSDVGVHNVFLSRAVELGLVGAVLWTVALLLAVGRAIATRAPQQLEPWRIGLAAIAVQWLVAANLGPLPYTFPNLLLWTWAGIVLAPVARTAWHRRGDPNAAKRLPRSRVQPAHG